MALRWAVEEMERRYQLLADFSVRDIASFNKKLEGMRDLAARKKHWHEHVNFFTEASLRAVLARCGLTAVAFEARSRASHANFSEVLAFASRRKT